MALRQMATVVRALLGERSAPYRVLMLGLHGSGKTSCVCRMRGEDNYGVVPTISFNVFEHVHCGARLQFWDVGGADAWVRPLVKHYFPNTRGVVLVVDSTDLQHMGVAEASTERWDSTAASMLRQLLAEPELLDVPVLILANKSDLSNAKCADVRLRLGVDALMGRTRRRWHITSSSAVTGEGLQGGLDWLVRQLEMTGDDSCSPGALLAPPEYLRPAS